MNTLINIVGMVCLCLGIISILISSIGFLISHVNDYRDRLVSDARTLAKKEMGSELIRASWWFSEDESTRLAMAILGQAIQADGTAYQISPIRDQWREGKINEKN